MNFSAQFHVKRITFEKFTKDFDKKAMGLVYRAAREWLKAVIRAVPVWTGFAQGSIKFARGPNGNLQRYLNVAMPISARAERPKWYYHPGRANRIRKIPTEAGRFGAYKFVHDRHVYRFRFRSNVVHFILNEFYSHPQIASAPWYSLDDGWKAFDAYIRENWKKLPHIFDYIRDLPLINISNEQLRIIGHVDG